MNIEIYVEYGIRCIGIICCLRGILYFNRGKDKLFDAKTDEQKQDAKNLKKIAWILILMGACFLLGGGYIMDFITTGLFNF